MTKIKVRLPQFGMGMKEAEILRWLKQPGDRLDAGDALLEAEAEKTTVEVPSPTEGTLTEILHQPGEVVEVKTHIATIETGEADNSILTAL